MANQNIIAIINQSIANAWQGLFAFKTKQSKASVRQSEKDDLMAYFDSLEAAKWEALTALAIIKRAKSLSKEARLFT